MFDYIQKIIIFKAKIYEKLMVVKEDIDLKDFNTFRISAKAPFLVEIEELDEILYLKDFAKNKNLPIFILGEGSNVLFAKNTNFVFTKLKIKGLKIIKEDKEGVELKINAGHKWDDFVRWSVEKDLYGAVNLSYIPGTVGAAPVQNIGAYGVELKDILKSVQYFDIERERLITLSNEQCQFGYRDSIFKHQLKGKAIITSIIVRLSKKPFFNLEYKDLQPLKKATNLNLRLVRLTIGKIRSKKLPFPEQIGNAGSFFKNPIVDKTVADDLLKEYPDMPYFPISEKKVKLAAGWLIDKAGLKGFRMGDAAVYEHNALVIVNLGSATGEQVLQLASFVQETVYKKFHIHLEPEVTII